MTRVFEVIDIRITTFRTEIDDLVLPKAWVKKFTEDFYDTNRFKRSKPCERTIRKTLPKTIYRGIKWGQTEERLYSGPLVRDGMEYGSDIIESLMAYIDSHVKEITETQATTQQEGNDEHQG